MNGSSALHTIKHEQKEQAQSFFKVMVKKGYDVAEIADTLQHMGQMLIVFAEDQAKGKYNGTS
jgi:hypothetical protein